MSMIDFEYHEPILLHETHHCTKCGWVGDPIITLMNDKETIHKMYCSDCSNENLIEGDLPACPHCGGDGVIERDEQPSEGMPLMAVQHECGHCAGTGSVQYGDRND